MLSSKSSASCRLTMLPPARPLPRPRPAPAAARPPGDAGPGGRALRAEAGGGPGGGAGREQAGRPGPGPPAPGGVTHGQGWALPQPQEGVGAPTQHRQLRLQQDWGGAAAPQQKREGIGELTHTTPATQKCMVWA